MKKNITRSILLALIALIVSFNLIFAFGQNKVQYTELSWQNLQSKHFSLYFHQDQSDIPLISLKIIEKSYNQLSKRFGYTHKERIPLIIYGNPNLFAQTNIITDILPEDVGGFTELLKNRIAVPFNGNYIDLRHVLHHELVHAFQFGILNDQIGGNIFATSMQVPFWFMEGSAEYLSSGWDIEADMFLLDKTIHSEIPLPGPELNGYMAYKGGQSFLFYLESSKGDSAFDAFLKEFRRSRAVEQSLKKIYGKGSIELGKEWIRELKRIYWPEIGRRIDATQNSIAITSHVDSRNRFNLRPRIAPNCSTIAFFSDHNDYTEILLTDKDGTIKHNISQNGYGGYFESFHPFRSGMCWSSDSKRLAFVTKNGGIDEIRIIDIVKRKLVRKLKIEIPSISSPDWSSHGSHLVFTGVDKGISDLYLYDLAKDSLVRLTSSIQVESDPRFSPNGVEILFSIQDTSIGVDLPKSAYGRAPSDLQLLNINTGKIRSLTSTPWNEKQACFSPDGNQIAFVSDRNGIDNIYIGPTDSLSKALPLTDYIGSCSNPDWAGSSIAFGLFQHQGWDIHLIESPMSKLKKDTLAITRWVESKQDSSVHYFLPSTIEIDSLQKNNKQRHNKQNLPDSNISEVTEPSIKSTPQKPLPSGIDSSLVQKNTMIVSQSDSILIKSDSMMQSPDYPYNTLSGSVDTTVNDSIVQIGIVNDTTNGDSDSSLIEEKEIQSLVPTPYRLKFSPDVVSLGVGISTMYSPAGQAMISLSDILGNHRITIAGDIQGNLKDYMHLYLSYFFLRERIDIGIGGYISKDYSTSGIFEKKLFHDVENAAFFLAQYPFSLISRIDFSLFASHLEREPIHFEGSTIKSTTVLPILRYIFDNTMWGITGPINGLRASGTVTVSPPFDFIEKPYLSVDFDIRNYVHILKRFVWANRLYTGVSVPLSDDSPARRYFLGGNENWIIFDVNEDQYRDNLSSISHSDFVTPLRGWNYLDMTGTKTVLINSEFRFPFIREISLVWPIPLQIKYINGAVFVDAGNAWDESAPGSGLPLPDDFFGGFGFGMRANLGIFVLRFDRGWPTDWNDIGKPINYFSLGAEF